MDKDKRITLRITAEQYARLDEMAQADKRSVGFVVREMIQSQFDREDEIIDAHRDEL